MASSLTEPTQDPGREHLGQSGIRWGGLDGCGILLILQARGATQVSGVGGVRGRCALGCWGNGCAAALLTLWGWPCSHSGGGTPSPVLPTAPQAPPQTRLSDVLSCALMDKASAAQELPWPLSGHLSRGRERM